MHKSKIEAIATSEDVDRDLPPKLVETLTRSGAWEEAARINETIYASISNTTEKRAQKLAANLDRIAARYEASIALGQIDALPALAAEWKKTEAHIREHRDRHA